MNLFGSSQVQVLVERYFRSLKDLSGKTVIDVFAGKGKSTQVIREMGAHIEAYDLFPEFFEVEGMTCKKADMANGLPIEDSYADIALFQEGIEHLPDQLNALREFNRVLKPSGKLILTTPNISHLRAKLSNLLVENEIYNKMPISETDAIWYSGETPQEVYYGHIFLIGVQKLRVLAKLTGFDITKVHAVKFSRSSLFLGIFYPIILLTNLLAFARSVGRDKQLDRGWKIAVYGEALKLNLSPTILFGKHLFIELQKTKELHDVSPNFFKKFNNLQPAQEVARPLYAARSGVDSENPCDPLSNAAG